MRIFNLGWKKNMLSKNECMACGSRLSREFLLLPQMESLLSATVVTKSTDVIYKLLFPFLTYSVALSISMLL